MVNNFAIMEGLRVADMQARPQSVGVINRVANQSLAAEITRAASKQTYATIRYLVDRPLVADAYRAYAYFRWVDDCLDQNVLGRKERIAFLRRQQSIIHHAYQGGEVGTLTVAEQLICNLIHSDSGKSAGLRVYIDNMMAVMAFDSDRRGRIISQVELAAYSRWLATAVTEALHHFIGHDCAAPQDESRYMAVTGAHITHLLRDTVEDAAAGYYNIPHEYLETHGIAPDDFNCKPYRDWVRSRVELARDCFAAGREHMQHVESARCRLAGFAYIARFEVVLNAIERDGYRLRPNYPERRSSRAALWMGWQALTGFLQPARRSAGIEETSIAMPREVLQ